MITIHLICADLRARLVRLGAALTRSFRCLRQAVLGPLAAAHEAVAKGTVAAGAALGRLVARSRSTVAPRLAAVLGHLLPGDPATALPRLAGLYVAVVVGGAIANLVGVPWPLLAPLALVQGLLKLALVVAVLGSWLDHLDVPAGRRSALRTLRVCAAVGLLWLAGLSLAAGHAILPRATAGAAVPATAGARVIPSPFAASSPTVTLDPSALHEQGVSPRPTRTRRRSATTTTLS